jgi:hypothetical protein
MILIVLEMMCSRKCFTLGHPGQSICNPEKCLTKKDLHQVVNSKSVGHRKCFAPTPVLVCRGKAFPVLSTIMVVVFTMILIVLGDDVLRKCFTLGYPGQSICNPEKCLTKEDLHQVVNSKGVGHRKCFAPTHPNGYTQNPRNGYCRYTTRALNSK